MRESLGFWSDTKRGREGLLVREKLVEALGKERGGVGDDEGIGRVEDDSLKGF